MRVSLIIGGKSVTELKKLGRPTKYNFRLATELIKRIMAGEAVCSIIKDKHMPANSTLYKWLANKPIFAERYAQALEFRTHLKSEERHAVINDAINKIQYEEMPEGFNAAVWGNLIKEKVRAIEWDAERLAPIKYKSGYKAEAKDLSPDITINFVDAVKPSVD